MKIKNTVSINLILSIVLLSAGLFVAVNAETTQKLFLNTNLPNSTDIRFEKVGTVPCTSQTCFKRPIDAVISSDGSFILLADSSSPANLKKFNFSAGSFTDALTLPLIQKSSTSSLLNISLNQNNTKAAIYRELTEGYNTLV